MIHPAQFCDSVLTKNNPCGLLAVKWVFLLYSTQIVIYKMLLSWTSLTGRLQLLCLFYWPLVLHIFRPIIKTWGYKGCLKHKILEHVGHNIFLFLFNLVPKAAEPFSSETAHANCLRHWRNKFWLESLIMVISSWEWGCRVGWQFSWPLPLPWGLSPASKCFNSSVCNREWWGCSDRSAKATLLCQKAAKPPEPFFLSISPQLI